MEQEVEMRIRDVGKFYGYPDCCINSFCERKFIGDISEEQRMVHNGSGFIPCKNHSMEIIAGKIKIESLIQNRECQFPFFTDSKYTPPEELRNFLIEKFEEFEHDFNFLKEDLLKMPSNISLEYFCYLHGVLQECAEKVHIFNNKWMKAV